MIGFQLGKVGDNEFSEVQSLNKLQEYASLIGLDRKTGIELSEATPKVSDAKQFHPIWDREITCLLHQNWLVMLLLWLLPGMYLN